MTSGPHRPGWAPQERRDLSHVAAVVVEWIEACDSPLYAHLAREIAADAQMLTLVSRIENVPPLNILFASVKLALREDDALAAWYPHLAGSDARPVDDGVYQVFRTFALERAEQIERAGRERRTQTNEVGRAAAILPWVVREADRVVAQARLDPGSPVHLVDLGTSAGLNLCLDRFDYDYSGTMVHTRNPASARVTLACDNLGGFALPSAPPGVGERVGLDLAPLDASDPDAAAWLEALVWPEHQDRLERLRAALAIRRETPVRLVAGDATRTLAALADELPPGPAIVFHTVMAYQLDAQQLARLDDAVAVLAATRPVARVALEPMEISHRPLVRVGLRWPDAESVAKAHAHGRWLDRV